MGTTVHVEVEHLCRTMLTLVALGLVMAYSPTTLGIELRAAHHGPQVWRLVLAVVTGVALAATLLGALMCHLGPVVLGLIPRGGLRGVLELRWLDLAASLILVIAGVWRWLRRRRPVRGGRLSVALDKPVTLVVVVFLESLVSTTGPATMWLVVRTFAATRLSLWPLESVAFVLGLSLPYAVLGVVVMRLPAAGIHGGPWVPHQQQWRRLTSWVLVLGGMSLALVVILEWP